MANVSRDRDSGPHEKPVSPASMRKPSPRRGRTSVIGNGSPKAWLARTLKRSHACYPLQELLTRRSSLADAAPGRKQQHSEPDDAVLRPLRSSDQFFESRTHTPPGPRAPLRPGRGRLPNVALRPAMASGGRREAARDRDDDCCHLCTSGAPQFWIPTVLPRQSGDDTEAARISRVHWGYRLADRARLYGWSNREATRHDSTGPRAGRVADLSGRLVLDVGCEVGDRCGRSC
jgi:hypothetical protein